MYNLFDIFKQIILITKNNNYTELNYDINRCIFSFVIDDYKKIINKYYINNYIDNTIFKCNFLGLTFTMYFDILPYYKSIEKEEIKSIIDLKISKNSNLFFGKYINDNEGICYYHIDNYYFQYLNI